VLDNRGRLPSTRRSNEGDARTEAEWLACTDPSAAPPYRKSPPIASSSRRISLRYAVNALRPAGVIR
jgi:hypothetical protein